MTFPKCELTYREMKIASIFLFISFWLIYLATIPTHRFAMPYFALFLMGPLASILVFFISETFRKELITIDENGIVCKRKDELLWSYDWDSIAWLKRGAYYRMPSVAVVTYDKFGVPGQYGIYGHCFQLSKAAKEALKKYYDAEKIRYRL